MNTEKDFKEISCKLNIYNEREEEYTPVIITTANYMGYGHGYISLSFKGKNFVTDGEELIDAIRRCMA